MLGALLLSGDELMPTVLVDEHLAAEDFYREQHGAVFKAMVGLYEESRPIDWLTVAAQMREQGHLGEDTPQLLDELHGWVPAAGNARQYARIVKNCALRRGLLHSTYELQAGIHQNRPIRELIDEAEQRMLSVTDVEASTLGVIEPTEELERMRGIRDGVEVVGLGSGFTDLDKLTSGFHPGNLIVLAARPSMGKSALVVNFAEHVVAKGAAVALFSLEMSRSEILRRLLASRARVSGDMLLRGPIPPDRWEKIESAVDEVSKWPLFVDEGLDLGVIDVRAKARRLHRRVGLGLVIVDYVQLMRGDTGVENRNIEVGKITRGLKVLAKELEVPVIAVSQLSRAVEQRSDKRPMLSDLRDSGSVEQDADLVMFLYRESYYKKDEVQEPDATELNISKQRNGPLGTVKLTFLDKYPRFASYHPADSPMFSGPRSTDGEAMAF